MEYDCSNADRLGDDAWIGAVFLLAKYECRQENLLILSIRKTSNVNGAKAPSREEFYNV